MLQAPGIAGAARVASPFDATGLKRTTARQISDQIREWLDVTSPKEERSDDARPLVNPDPAGLGCDTDGPKDVADARPTQSAQESPQRG